MQDGAAGAQVFARVESCFVGQSVAGKISLVDLSKPHTEIDALRFERFRRRHRFSTVTGLANKVPTNDADRVRVEAGFSPHDRLKRRGVDVRRALLGQGVEIKHDFPLCPRYVAGCARTI